MSFNKYKPHIIILLEDDAIRQIANGFKLYFDVNPDQIFMEKLSGGFSSVRADFEKIYVKKLRSSKCAHVVIFADFDGMLDDHSKSRLAYFEEKIPEDIRDRVFIVGPKNEAEDAHKAVKGNYEAVGEALAKDCADGTTETWDSEQWQHNKTELNRMVKTLKPIVFSA